MEHSEIFLNEVKESRNYFEVVDRMDEIQESNSTLIRSGSEVISV